MSTLTVANINGVTGGISPVPAETQQAYVQANVARQLANTSFNSSNTAISLAVALGV